MNHSNQIKSGRDPLSWQFVFGILNLIMGVFATLFGVIYLVNVLTNQIAGGTNASEIKYVITHRHVDDSPPTIYMADKLSRCGNSYHFYVDEDGEYALIHVSGDVTVESQKRGSVERLYLRQF